MASAEPYDHIVEKARQSLGGHELHITPSGEQHQYELGSKSLADVECSKNPGHPNFIPRTKFTMKHLPTGFQNQLMYDWVDTTAELTGLLTLNHVSEGRPETWPGTRDPYPCGNSRGEDLCQTGTGRVREVDDEFYTHVDGVPCPCGVCTVSETPSYSWGRFTVLTAAHVLVDEVEVKASNIRLFYRSGSPQHPQVKVAYGEAVEGCVDIDRDWCDVCYVTHDKAVHDTLRETLERWRDLCEKTYDKYRRYYTYNNWVGNLAVIVSHPHATHQHITVGKITHREKEVKRRDYNRYTYSTDTCPGSSGATVLMPGCYNGWWVRHPHSRACPPGQCGNQSAFWY